MFLIVIVLFVPGKNLPSSVLFFYMWCASVTFFLSGTEISSHFLVAVFLCLQTLMTADNARNINTDVTRML